MRGRLRSAPRSSTRPPQRWQRPTKTRDPNWHRAGSGSTRVRMEAGREATTSCWDGEPNLRATRGSRIVAEGTACSRRLRKERCKSQNLTKKEKQRRPGRCGPPVGRQPGDRKNQPKLEFLPDRKSTRLNSSHRCISYAVF